MAAASSSFSAASLSTKVAVGQPSGTVGIEQVAQHRAARRLVGGDADEAGQFAVGGDVLFGQRIADRLGPLLCIVRQPGPDFFLRPVIVGDRESHQAIERHRALAVGGDQLRADHGQLEPLPHGVRRDAEPRRDLFLALAVIGQLLERLELVGGMHRLAHFVFGEADLGRVRAFAHLTGNAVIGGDLLLLREKFERGKAAASGDNFVSLAVRADLQVLQQPVRHDAGGQPRDIGLGLADIGGGGDKSG